jgi:type I restriction enzyme S subunit
LRTATATKTKWVERKIGDDCIVGDGAHAKIQRQTSGVMYLTCKNLKEGGLDLSKVDYISELDYLKYFRDNSKALTKPKADDVVFSIIGTIGEPYLVKSQDSFGISSSVAILRPNKTVLSPKYIYFWINAHIFQNALYAIKGGVAQGYVSLEMIRSLPLYYPELAVQDKIAAILSAYDRLIENNTRRIEILEEMARSLYREWFVNFRFPGHEQAQMVDSELGLIPEGWEVKTIGEIINTVGGGTPSTTKPEYWDDGDIIWYVPKNLTAADTMFITESEKKITALGLQKSSARMFPAYSVMMTSRATIGVVAINTKAACTNQGFITCIPNDQLSAYQIYFWLKESIEKISNLATGSTFKEINKTTFRNLTIVIAEMDIRNHFVETLTPICKQIENLQSKNINLRQTRDLLLPRLISGEIDVENLEINTGELANPI